MTPRYTWTPASEPPDTEREVIVWFDPSEAIMRGQKWTVAKYHKFHALGDDGVWTASGVIHWRDIEPPEAGE